MVFIRIHLCVDYYFLQKAHAVKWAIASIPILLTISLAFGKYSLLLFDNTFNIILFRNFIFVGLPYTMMGFFVGKSQKNAKKITKKFSFFLIMIFGTTSCIERYLLQTNNIMAKGDCFISTFFLSLSIFFFFIGMKSKKNVISDFGKKYALMIYIIHPVFIWLLKQINFTETANNCKSFIVFALSLCFSIAFYKIKAKITFAGAKKNR